MPSLELSLKKELPPLVANAEDFEIVEAKDMTRATEMLSTVNQRIDAITEEKEKVTKPANEVLKAERARWKPMEDVLTRARDILRAKISSYQTEMTRKAKEEADKIASRIGPGKGKLSIDKASDRIANIEKPEEKVQSASGSLRFRTDKVLKITDDMKIPRQYLVADEKLILSALKKGEKVPGCEIEEIQTPINSL